MKAANSSSDSSARVIAVRIALVGMAIAFITTLVAPLLAPQSNMIADTISDVAAGPYDWVQDLGFYTLAVALLSLAYAMRNSEPDSWGWTIASVGLAVMGVAVALMAYFEFYSSNPDSDAVIHYRLVYVYGGAFFAVLLLTARGLAKDHRGWLVLNIALAVGWAALAVFFFTMGTGWDGIVERALALAQIAWLYLFAWKVEHEGGDTHLPDRYVPDLVSANSARAA